MIRLRKDFLKGEKPAACQECWNFEKRGLQSERLSPGNMELSNQHQEKIRNEYKDGIVKEMIGLEIRPSNACNFTCRMCTPEVSSSWAKKDKEWQLYPNEANTGLIKAYKSSEELVQELSPFFSGLEFIKIHGGEPLFEPQVLDLLKALQPYKEKVWLRWMTNLSIVDHPFYTSDLLKGWKRMATAISIDGPPPVNEYIRKGLDTALFEKNLEKLQLLGADIFFHISLQAMNIIFIPEFINYILKLKPYRLTFSRVDYPTELATIALSKESKESAYERLLKYQESSSFTQAPDKLKEDIHLLIVESLKILKEPVPQIQEKLWQNLIDWNYRIDGDKSLFTNIIKT